MVDEAKVKLGADTGEAVDGMSKAAGSINGSLDEISKGFEQLERSNETLDQSIKDGTDKIAEGFGELKGKIGEAIEDIKGRIEVFKTVIGGVVAAVSGGAVFGEAVKETLDLEESVRSLSIAFGISTEEATRLDTQLKLAGVSMEAFEKTAINIGRRMIADGGEAFDRLGVSIRDAAGDLLPMQEAMQNTYKRIMEFKAGTDQELASLELTGRSALSFASDMERMNAVADRSRQLMAELGIEMGDERIAEIERYRTEVNAFKIVISDLGDRIGAIVIPHLEQLARWLMSNAETITGVVIFAVKSLVSALAALGMILRELALFIKIPIQALWDFAGALSTVLDFAKGDASWDQVKQRFSDIATHAENTANHMLDTWRRYNAEVNALWDDSAAKLSDYPDQAYRAMQRAQRRPVSGNEHYIPKARGGQRAEDTAWMENELKAEQDAYNKKMLMQGSFEVWSETQTRDYWEEILSMTTLSAKERQEAENKYYDAERKVQTEAFNSQIAGLESELAMHKYNSDARIAIVQREVAMITERYGEGSRQAIDAQRKLTEEFERAAVQRERIAEIEQQKVEATYKHELAMYKLAEDQKVALQQESSAQRYEAEARFLQQEYQQNIDWINKRIAWAAANDPENVEKMQQLDAEKLAIEQKYQEQLTALTNKAIQDRLRDQLAANDAIRSDMESLISSLETNIRNWRDAFKQGAAAIEKTLADLASKTIVKELFGPGTTGGDWINKLTGLVTGTTQGGGAAAAKAAEAASSKAVTTANTEQATSTQFLTTLSTTLSTVFTTLTTAASAAAAALATVGGGGGGGLGGLLGDFGEGTALAGFAEGTPYVPHDMIAMIHQGEAVIPAAYNKPGAMGSTLHAHMNFNISGPVDTRTQDQIAAAAFRGIYRAHRRVL